MICQIYLGQTSINVLIFIPITQNKSDFRVTCKIKTNYSKSTFQYASANLWKTLPTDVKIAKTYFTYKNLFKDYCTGKYHL